MNDRHSQHVGDKLLVALAQTMSATLREGDTLARIAGDDFVAVLIELGSTACCMPPINRHSQAAPAPVPLADQLLPQADQAMYQAKLAGKNRIQSFGPARRGCCS